MMGSSGNGPPRRVELSLAGSGEISLRVVIPDSTLRTTSEWLAGAKCVAAPLSPH